MTESEASLATEHNPWGLDPNEQTILDLRAKHAKNKEIAETLGYKEQTIKNMLCALRQRLHEQGHIPPDCDDVFSLTAWYEQQYGRNNGRNNTRC